jgi:hypothetical protein
MYLLRYCLYTLLLIFILSPIESYTQSDYTLRSKSRFGDQFEEQNYRSRNAPYLYRDYYDYDRDYYDSDYYDSDRRYRHRDRDPNQPFYYWGKDGYYIHWPKQGK